jgi:hypothetical protein
VEVSGFGGILSDWAAIVGASALVFPILFHQFATHLLKSYYFLLTQVSVPLILLAINVKLTYPFTQITQQPFDSLLLPLTTSKQDPDLCKNVQINLRQGALLYFRLISKFAFLTILILRFLLVGRFVHEGILLVDGLLRSDVSEGRVRVGSGRPSYVVRFILVF